MSDLIDRDAAIKALWKIRDERDSVYYTSAIYAAVDAIEKLPTVEPRVISPDEFRDMMIEIRERNDGEAEMTHICMDIFMCETLKLLGYGEGVEVFEKQDKWYS